MIRAIDDYDLLDRFVLDFCSIVEKHCRYVIVSGFFAISCGRVRGTEDIDMILPKLKKEDFLKLHDELKSMFACLQSNDYEEIYEYLVEGASVRYTYIEEDLPEMEIKFAKDELDLDQILNRKKYVEITGLDIFFAPLNGQIAFKEEYLKSEKDLEDAVHLRKVFRDEILEEEIERYKKRIRKVKL